MSRKWIQDILDLLEEQHFRVVALMGGNGVRVMPNSAGMQPVVLYYGGHESELQNVRARLRRIGVSFPGDVERSRARHTESQHRSDTSMATANTPTQSKQEQQPALGSVIAAIRQKHNAIMSQLSEAEALVNQLEADAKRVQALRDLLRQI